MDVDDIRHELPTGVGLRPFSVAAYALTALLGLSLLAVGTIAVIAQLKGTWHWMIHLESMISYMSLFVGVLVAALVPIYGALALGRWWIDE